MKVLQPEGGALTGDLVRRGGVGEVVAKVEWGPITASSIAFYCAAIGMVDPIHYNITLAREFGFDELVVNGTYRWLLMTLTASQMFTPWASITESNCRHLAPMPLGSRVLVELAIAEPNSADSSAGGGQNLPLPALSARNVVDGAVVDESSISLRMEA